MEQHLADLQESLGSFQYVVMRHLRELDEAERLSRGPMGFIRFCWCEIFGHAKPYKHTDQCSRCGL